MLHERLVSYQVSVGARPLGEPHKGLFYVLPGTYIALPLTAAERAAAGGSVEILGDEGKISIPLSPAE